MQLNTAGRPALAAMLDLALREQHGPVTLAAIGHRQQVSASYLEQLFGRLRRHGLVVASRGPGGGYMLSRPGAQISVGDIIAAVDKASASGKAAKEAAAAAATLPADALWARLHGRLMDCLQAISLQELVDEEIAKGLPPEPPPMQRGISSRPVLEPISVSTPNWVFAWGPAGADEARLERDRP